MKIAITGTRGIPNRYGGFEQFSERLSGELALRGHHVWVYNPHFHSFRQNHLVQVEIVRRWSPERCFGSGANYLYDYLCLINAINREADIILECGYATAAPWYPVLPRKSLRLVTHMDGMEWKRTKWNPLIQRWIRKAEKKAIALSDAVVCDHPLIAQYIKQNYAISPDCIPYGTDVLSNPDEHVLDQYGLQSRQYYLILARLEPENNIQMMIEGYLAANTSLKLVVVGDLNTRHAHKLYMKYSRDRAIHFLGGIFDDIHTGNLRYFCRGLFHGHSVGGTNPSLLEAMASGAPIMAHDNPYNRYVLGENARYFSCAGDIAEILHQPDEPGKAARKRRQNLNKIKTEYRWDKVTDQYEKLFFRLTGK